MPAENAPNSPEGNLLPQTVEEKTDILVGLVKNNEMINTMRQMVFDNQIKAIAWMVKLTAPGNRFFRPAASREDILLGLQEWYAYLLESRHGVAANDPDSVIVSGIQQGLIDAILAMAEVIRSSERYSDELN